MNKIVPSMIKNTPFWKQGGVFFYMWNSSLGEENIYGECLLCNEYDEQLNEFLTFLRVERGLAKNTVKFIAMIWSSMSLI